MPVLAAGEAMKIKRAKKVPGATGWSRGCKDCAASGLQRRLV